jgi:hypothetical protein
MSNAEKRSVSTDALETLGTIITKNEKRDAIHLAVEPALATQDLHPGDDVGFVAGGVGPCDKPLGIVDPFLRKYVKKGYVAKGEWFWLVLYPRQITSLRHVWSHPAFPDEPERVHSVADEEKIQEVYNAIGRSDPWIRDYAATIGVEYDELIEHTKAFVSHGEYWSEGDRFISSPGLPDEYWDHFEEVTNSTVPDDKKHSFFSCSC